MAERQGQIETSRSIIRVVPDGLLETVPRLIVPTGASVGKPLGKGASGPVPLFRQRLYLFLTASCV